MMVPAGVPKSPIELIQLSDSLTPVKSDRFITETSANIDDIGAQAFPRVPGACARAPHYTCGD